MRVATWNINGLRARLDYLRFWLQARKPDVVGLQELKITDDEFPTEFFSELGYHATTYGQKAWNGVAVLSLRPAEVLERGLPGEDDFGARLLRVKVDELQFTTVYCPNGKDLGHDDFPKKLAWFDSLLRYWATQDRNTPAVLCGDFNLVPTALDTLAHRRHRRSDLPHQSRARSIRRPARSRPDRSVPASPSRQESVLVVGLSRRRIPQRARLADRHGAGDRRGRAAREGSGDRSRLSQEGRRVHRFGSRAGVCRPRLASARAGVRIVVFAFAHHFVAAVRLVERGDGIRVGGKIAYFRSRLDAIVGKR